MEIVAKTSISLSFNLPAGTFAVESSPDPSPAESDAKKLNEGFWRLYHRIKAFKIQYKHHFSTEFFIGGLFRPVASSVTQISSTFDPFGNPSLGLITGITLTPNADIKLEKMYNLGSSEEINSITYNLRW